MLFILLHESAHGLVNQMELPVLGKEEDAADAFATVTMLSGDCAIARRAGRGIQAGAIEKKGIRQKPTMHTALTSSARIKSYT
jgi:NOL1/NOP2/fmu family ribosome biogenesis protein